MPYVPFFPLVDTPSILTTPVLAAPSVVATATRLGVTAAQVGLAWLLQLFPNVLLIGVCPSRQHLRENLAAADLALDHLALEQIG